MKNQKIPIVVCAAFLLATLLLAGPSFGQVRFNIRIGPPPPLREVVVAAPFPGAVWVPGYYAFDYAVDQYRWHPGVWMHPPFAGAVWMAPRYAFRRGYYGFMAGHWATPPVLRSRAYGRWRGYRRGYARGGYARGGRPVRFGRAPMGQ